MSELNSNSLFDQLSVEELEIEEFELCLESTTATHETKSVAGGQMAW